MVGVLRSTIWMMIAWCATVGALPDLTAYLLPDDHPAREGLDEVCADLGAFVSVKTMEAAGFASRDLSGQCRPWGILVAGHPKIQGYLIKTYPITYSDPPYDYAIELYVKRLYNAQRIRDYLEERGSERLVVPHKWLYKIPGDREQPIYVLVVEDMEILAGSYAGGPTLERYRDIDRETLREVCEVLIDLGGCDAWPQNLPFTKKGQIAFVDTEWVNRRYGDLLRTLVPYLTPEMQKFAREIWLEHQGNDGVDH